jgi:hypothetical protein
MTFQITFTVDGEARGKGRPRFARRGNFVQTYTDDRTRTYEDHVRESAKRAMGATEPLETPVSLSIYIRVSVPKSYSKKRTKNCLDQIERPTKKPDNSNVLKSIEDSCNGVIYKDDSQIVDSHTRKVYSSVAGVDVFIREELC